MWKYSVCVGTRTIEGDRKRVCAVCEQQSASALRPPLLPLTHIIMVHLEHHSLNVYNSASALICLCMCYHGNTARGEGQV